MKTKKVLFDLELLLIDSYSGVPLLLNARFAKLGIEIVRGDYNWVGPQKLPGLDNFPLSPQQPLGFYKSGFKVRSE